MIKKTLPIPPSIQNTPKKMVYFLAQLHSLAQLHQISLIIYRLPQTELEKSTPTRKKTSEPFTVIFSNQWNPPPSSNSATSSKLDQLKEIFIFHPHQASHQTVEPVPENPWGYFKADFIYSPIRGRLKVNHSSSPDFTSELISAINQTIKKLNKPSSSPTNTFNSIPSISSTPLNTPPLQKKSTLKKEFIQQANVAIQQLNQPKAKLKKVVLSKIKLLSDVSAIQPIALAERFIRLLNDPNFQNTLTTLIISPEVGYWMGASPEVLASQDRKGLFTTVSLAGTKTIKPLSSNKKVINHHFKNVTWSEKEIGEQADVSRFIIEAFKKIRLREYKENGPSTIKAGHLAHLKSSFTVNTKKHFGSNLLYKMASLLHPTSAICGTPRPMAQQLIDKLENHERRFYSGLLGPMMIDQESHLFVNLRCLEIGEKKVCLYSGAGITPLSDSIAEWEETESKIKVMQQLFKK